MTELRNGHNFVARPDGGGRYDSTPEQLRQAALRWAGKTRVGTVPSDQVDLGTDAALVSIAYLELTKPDPRADLMEPSIMLQSGRYFNFASPETFDWNIEDIAHGLAYQCRSTGQLRSFYSIAEHSLLVYWAAPPELKFEALLHDGAEFAYGDMATPLKILCPEYRALEKRGGRALRDAFGLPAEESPGIKQLDLRALATEKRDLMPQSDENWGMLEGIEPLPLGPSGMAPELAKRQFLKAFFNCARQGWMPEATRQRFVPDFERLSTLP